MLSIFHQSLIRILVFLRRIKYYLPYNARLLFCNSFVLPIFDYADLVWRDKDNVSLMNELQILQKKKQLS